jgi:hypothetical protein
VLIEGPADFNARLAELDLPHRLPIAIYSYLATETGHHGSWSPLAEHSPEWQALRAGHEVGAEVRFIDLPAWHKAFASLEKRYADVSDAGHEARAGAYEQALAERLSVQGRDALWDHLFENKDAGEALQEHLHACFILLFPEFVIPRDDEGCRFRLLSFAGRLAYNPPACRVADGVFQGFLS